MALLTIALVCFIASVVNAFVSVPNSSLNLSNTEDIAKLTSDMAYQADWLGYVSLRAFLSFIVGIILLILGRATV